MDDFMEMNETISVVNATEEVPERNVFILPWWQQLVWTSVFGSMIFIATSGNVIVMWIVLAHKRMRSVTNYFLVNLSLADTMVSTLNVIFNFIYMLDGHWPFGEAYCKISNFIAIVSVAASVFTLVAISIDRYMAIMHPLKPRMSRTATLNITVLIWILSIILSFPNLLYSVTRIETFVNGDHRVICYMEWPDGPMTQSDDEYMLFFNYNGVILSMIYLLLITSMTFANVCYNVIILIVTYVLPIASMTFTYFRVGRELWGSQTIGECTQKQKESVKSKRKIVKMMMVVVAIFAVCWLPYHVYFLLAHHLPWIITVSNVQHTYLSIYWLAMSNSMYNPIIYCWMNSRFRQGFKRVFCCCNWKEEHVNPFEKRNFATVRHSYSEPYTDTRVTVNGTANLALQTVTESLNNSNTSNTPFLTPKTPRAERFSHV